MESGSSMPLPGDDPMLGGLDSSGDFGDFALYDTQAMAADEPFLSALVDSWPELQHEQVAAAQNRAMDQPLQTDALFVSPEMLSSAPSMADLQREHEEQYGYQQMLGQQQQQYAYMPQQSVPQQPALASQYQQVGMYPLQQQPQQQLQPQSQPQQQQPHQPFQSQPYADGLPYGARPLQPPPAGLQPLPQYMPTSGVQPPASLDVPPNFPGLESPSFVDGRGSSLGGGEAMAGHATGGMPADMMGAARRDAVGAPTRHSFDSAPTLYPVASGSEDPQDLPRFGAAGSGNEFRRRSHDVSSGSSGNVDALAGWRPPSGEAAAAAVPTGDGAAAGGHRSGSGSGGAHAAEDGASAGLGVEDKIAKVKEKNRRAQQRFRERQRARLSEAQERAQVLRASITQLKIEHELLINRNTMLEKFKAMRQAEERETDVQQGRMLEGPQEAASGSSSVTPSPAQSPAIAQAASEASDGHAAAFAAAGMATPPQRPPSRDGMDAPQVEGAALVLTVRDGQHVTLTTEQIKRMPWQQHARIWKEYVCRLAELLVEAKSDPESAAGKRAAVLVREAVTLAATISIHNPRGYRTWHCNRMEAETAEESLPTRDFWHGIMRNLKMPEEQRNGMRQLRRLYLGRLGDVLRKRQRIAAQLQPSATAFDGGRGSVVEYCKVVDIAEQLQANLAEEHQLLQTLMINITFRIGRPLQAANVIVQAYPWAPDMLAIINCLAEEEGDPSAGELLSMGYEAAVGLKPGSEVQTRAE